MPILAAALGVLGGVGGAYIGGTVANEGQEKASEREQAAADRALRRDAYSAFLGTAQEVYAVVLKNQDRMGTAEAKAEIDAAAVGLYPAQARVDIVAKSAEVRDAAEAVRDALVEDPDDSLEELEQPEDLYRKAAEKFRTVARNDLEQTE